MKSQSSQEVRSHGEKDLFFSLLCAYQESKSMLRPSWFNSWTPQFFLEKSESDVLIYLYPLCDAY